MNKIGEFIINIIVLFLSFVFQDWIVRAGLFEINNIFMDFVSFLAIFVVVYIIAQVIIFFVKRNGSKNEIKNKRTKDDTPQNTF